MTQSRTAFSAGFSAAPPSRAESVVRLEQLSALLDSAFKVPGTNVRLGLDSLIGLVPGIGDLVSTAVSSYIIWEARRLGLPRWKIARMIGNVALDTTVGAVPLLGDVADVFFKANRRNMRIIREHLARDGVHLGRDTLHHARAGKIIDAEYTVTGERRR